MLICKAFTKEYKGYVNKIEKDILNWKKVSNVLSRYYLFFLKFNEILSSKEQKYDIMKLFIRMEVNKMTEKELKRFIINLIESKEKENENYIRYSYYELKIKNNLSENEIDNVLRISRDYFENKGYKVYFTNAEFEYQNARRKVETNEYMIALKD